MTKSLEQRVADLEAETAYLRSELGLSLELSDINTLRSLGLSKQEARIILALRAAKGRVLSNDQLCDAGYSETDDTMRLIKVCIAHVRSKLRRHNIPPTIVETAWGIGYRMPREGAVHIDRVLAGAV